MKYVPWLVTSLIFLAGCLDFIDPNNENNPPLAMIKLSGTSPFEPDTNITFSAEGSSDPDGDTLEFFWDFDKNDGKNEKIAGDIGKFGKTVHSYSTEGEYTVTLTVSDGNELVSEEIVVTIKTLKSDIKAIINTEDETERTVKGEDQITFSFSAKDSISDSVITKYEWDFSYDSSDGFTTEKESKDSDTSWDFKSGLYSVRLRITNEMGETDESEFADDIDLKINYEYTSTKQISSEQQEHPVQLYSIPARYVRATLEYDAGNTHATDLDLYLYNTTQERKPDDDEGNNQNEECNVCVAKNYTHDTGSSEQLNDIELDYYNSSDRKWFDNVCNDEDRGFCEELGDWFIVVDHERGSADYTIRIEVIYWESN